MTIADKLLQYQFKDSRRLIYATILGNLLLGILLMFPDFRGVFQNPHVIWCLTSAIILFVLLKAYHWKSFSINTGILVVYLLGVLVEYLQSGLPGTSLQGSISEPVSKGILFNMLVSILPGLYLAIRIFLGLGLFWVTKASRYVD